MYNREKWNYKLIKAISVDYPQDLRDRLIGCIQATGEELVSLDLELGAFIGKCISDFLPELNMNPDLIASHGHTVFHQPDKGMTKQIGDGQSILYKTGIPTICDFRTMDVIHGGQGAPLVPIGDQYLFSDYEVCLNIGGFANISYAGPEGQSLAFDTGPANILLNYLARKLGYPYDENGSIGRKGSVIPNLLDDLNNLPYYKASPPKSLGLEWVTEHIISRLNENKYELTDLMHTCVKHIAYHINQAIHKEASSHVQTSVKMNVLTTGGGAHNQFLLESLQEDQKDLKFVLPAREIIDYKEALIFAFLGILRFKKEINVFRSVTGARSDTIGGTIHDNF
jgi:anhydro-N-acetylmuramic acid kinase